MLSTKPPCEFEPKLWLPRNHGFQLSLRLCFHEVRKRRVRRRGLFSVGIGFGILISKVQLLSTLKGCGFRFRSCHSPSQPDFGRTCPDAGGDSATDCAALRYERKSPPACAGGSSLHSLGQLAYRAAAVTAAAFLLTLRLAPPLGPLSGPLPRTSPLETSLTQSEPLPL